MGAALSELDSSWAGGCLVHTEQAFFLNHLLRIWAVVWSWEKGAIFGTVAFIKMLLCFFLAAEPVSAFLCCPGPATHSVLITKDLLSFESLQQVLYIFDSDKTHNVVHGLPRLCPCGITQAAVTWHSSGLRLLAVRECQPHTTTITQRRWVEGCDWPFLDPCQGCVCVGGWSMCTKAWLIPSPSYLNSQPEMKKSDLQFICVHLHPYCVTPPSTPCIWYAFFCCVLCELILHFSVILMLFENFNF